MLEQSIGWGRSKLGCDGCKDPRLLAGFEVRVGAQVVAKLCSECAAAWHPGDVIGGNRHPSPDQPPLQAA